MIQIYLPENDNFEMNGDMTIFPTMCEAEAELCGTWVLNLTHPLDEEGRWKYIVEEAVISAPTFMGEQQLYRIDEVDKQDTEISAKAYPIFFDAADEVFLMDTRPTEKNGQQALDIMTKGSKFSGKSNISTGNTAYFIRRNLIDAINGSNEPTFVGTWGGEPVFDNYQVIINERAGGDYGAQVRYGMNMEHINCRISMASVATRIVPVAYNERKLSTGFADSPIAGKYAKIYTKEIVFEDVKLLSDLGESEDTEGCIVCGTQEELDRALIQKCNEQFNSGIDLPEVTIEVDMIALENTEEYKDFVDIVKVSLGDSVDCYNSNLDIETKERVVKITWDCISNTIKSVTLGSSEENVFNEFGSTMDRIEGILRNDGTVMAERVQGILDGIKTQIKIQSTAARPVEGRAFVVEDLDPESPLYGCMVYGTQGIQISKKRTADGRAWDFSTAMTANGIVADTIIAGMLSDRKGYNYWDLDRGILNIKKGTIHVDSDSYESVIKISHLNNKTAISYASVDVESEGFGLVSMNGVGQLIINADGGKGGNVFLINKSMCAIGEETWIKGDFYATGTKSRLVKTKSYNDRLLYCYEMPSPIFGDVGHGIIGEDKLCYVDIDPIFQETINTEQSYYVFLQPYNEEPLSIIEKQQEYFVVKGTPGEKFAWEVKAKQIDFPNTRLDENIKEDMHEEIDYISSAMEYLNNYEKELIEYE